MTMATDLMGLGLQGELAETISTGGVGPLLIASAGTNFATATQIKKKQLCVYNTDTDGTKAIALPTVSAGTTMANQYIVGNVTANSLPVYASTGVTISVGASLTSSVTLTTFTTAMFFPITSTTWIAVKGA